jgi:hypothetical protein
VIFVLLKVAFTWATPRETLFFTFFLRYFLAICSYSFFARAHTGSAYRLYASLDRNRLLASLARAGIGPRALPPDRKPANVPQAAVASDLLESLDILGNLPPQLTFNYALLVENRCNPSEFLVREFARPLVRINAGLFKNLVGSLRAHAVNVAQGDTDDFVIRNINTDQPGHCFLLPARNAPFLLSSLPLLVARIRFADHANHAAPADYLAVFASPPYRGLYLHSTSP